MSGTATLKVILMLNLKLRNVPMYRGVSLSLQGAFLDFYFLVKFILVWKMFLYYNGTCTHFKYLSKENYKL